MLHSDRPSGPLGLWTQLSGPLHYFSLLAPPVSAARARLRAGGPVLPFANWDLGLAKRDTDKHASGPAYFA